MSRPSNQIPPHVGYSRPATQNASVLLPDPDSPTTARVVPLRIVKDTSSRADSSSRTPARLCFAKRFTRFSTFMSGRVSWSLVDDSPFILETRNRLSLTQVHRCGFTLSADIHSFRASWLETTTFPRERRERRIASDCQQFCLAIICTLVETRRDGLKEGSRVWMARRCKHRCSWAQFDDAAAV